MQTTMLTHPAIRQAMTGFLCTILAASAAGATPARKDTAPAASTVRWAEGEPGCTFSRDDDGKYRYGLWTADFGIILAVDSQELEKVRRRVPPLLSLELTVRYRGNDSLDLAPSKITLEFVKHYNDTHRTLDPDELIIQQRNEAEALPEQAAREIRKHPQKKPEKEAAMTVRQQDIAEMIDFLIKRSLRSVKLESAHADAIGWIFFTTQSKWIDELRKQEEFVLRVPVNNRVVEFPFLLPPGEGDLILRRRPE
jgi:hypothetical protein